jgi:hypothetical protein
VRWIDRLERKMGRIAIPNLMILIVAGMFAVFLCDLMMPQLQVSSYITFDRDLIFKGQVWRLLTFIFLPTSNSVIWIVFSLYFYYLIGSTLEQQWGSFRFNVYYFIGMIGTIIGGFITGSAVNTFLNLSLFFAFAALFPNFQVLLFFILPIKIKYLAYLDAALFLVSFVMGSWAIRASILFSLLNFVIFFGGDFWRRMKMRVQYRKSQKMFREYYRNH